MKHEYKSFKFELKSVDEEKGIFEGIASAYRKSPDKTNDIAKPGCFKKSINEHPEVPSFFMHDIMLPIGTVALTDGANGLNVKGQLTRGVQKAEEALLLMKAGVIKTLSIGYDAIQKEFKDGIRYLTEVRVHEVSVVVGDFAADDMAVITAVKATEKDVAADYPWDECISDMMDEYGDEDTANRVCGMIRARSQGKDIKDKVKDMLPKINDLLEIKPKIKEPEAKEKALPVTEAVKDTPADKEAAEILDALKAYNIGFDPQAAEKRVEELLKKL